jgi:hypothetical protein
MTKRKLVFSLTEVYGVDEVFCTGRFPSQIHVTGNDGRKVGDETCGAIRLEKFIPNSYAKTYRGRGWISWPTCVYLVHGY